MDSLKKRITKDDREKAIICNNVGQDSKEVAPYDFQDDAMNFKIESKTPRSDSLSMKFVSKIPIPTKNKKHEFKCNKSLMSQLKEKFQEFEVEFLMMKREIQTMKNEISDLTKALKEFMERA